MNVVVIRTAGNQRYIFSSNKRQEIVGASELISRLDRIWVWEALRALFPGFDKSWRIGTHDAELLMAGAGVATVLVKDEDAARRLVRQVTARALRDAPGLDVCGVVVPYRPNAEGLRLIHHVLKAQRDVDAVRAGRPGPETRFRRLPLIAECASNGLPAGGLWSEGEGEPQQPRSAVALAKLEAFRESAFGRLADVAGVHPKAMQEVVRRLGLETEWVAVVHADGNALGELFQSLQDLPETADDAEYAELVRCLSADIDACAHKAFTIALRRTRAELEESEGGEDVLADGQPPIVPLILGGDDLTAICDGRIALTFTRHYLEAFEETTADSGAVRRVGRDHLSAAAGVAIVKRNYPFHFAYDLAEELIGGEAKKVKRQGSAVAFAVLLDSAAADLNRIRGSFLGRSASPYLVGRAAQGETGQTQRWQDLERRVAALRRTDPEGGFLIPRNVAHDLREGLAIRNGGVARARLETLRSRYAEDAERLAALDVLASGPEPLVGLPDAMAVLAFLPEQRA